MPWGKNADILLRSLQRAGIEVVASLPDAFLVHVLERLDESNEFLHLHVTREEEGIGICTGAYLGGKRSCMVMQNAGLLNAANALTTTALQIEIPMLLVVLYAGGRGDMSFPMLGQVTEGVIGGLGIPYYIPESIDQVPDLVADGVIQAYNAKNRSPLFSRNQCYSHVAIRMSRQHRRFICGCAVLRHSWASMD